jgi:dolichol-phosphate mannosyltransferase
VTTPGAGPESGFARRPRVSVVVPMRDEAGNAAALIAEIRIALAAVEHEIVCVDDGSRDGTGAILAACGAGESLRVLRHDRSLGQSAAIRSGVRAAAGRLIATIDGDGQNDPADLPAMIALHGRESADGAAVLVMGHRTTRRDTIFKRAASKAANAIRRSLLHDRTPDSGCGIKVLSRDLFLDLPYFDHMHRFMPALVIREGGRVVSTPVGHRPRTSGRSKYGNLDRLAVGIFDLFGVAWLMRRRALSPTAVHEPMRAGATARLQQDQGRSRHHAPSLCDSA